MTFRREDWIAFFPLPNVRPAQEEAINRVLTHFFDEGLDDVVCQLPTGTGKSAIAVTVARYVASRTDRIDLDYDVGAYVLTTQKTLSKQYADDFGGDANCDLVELKSSSNYACSYDPRQSCSESRRTLRALGKNAQGSDWYRHCTCDCAFAARKRRFVESAIGVTNYSYFLAESRYSGRLKPRQLLVMDEAHSVDAEVCKFIEVEATSRMAKRLDVPFVRGSDQASLHRWVSTKYRSALRKRAAFVNGKLNDLAEGKADPSNDAFQRLVRENDALDKHVCKLNRVLDDYTEEEWIVDRDDRRDDAGNVASSTVRFKPIEASLWAYDSLLKSGWKRLYMSATILDKDSFCRGIGLDPDLVGYVEAPSNFPVENRPVHYMPVGKMSMAESHATLPKLARAIREILESHAAEKGIVFTASFAVSEYLRQNVDSDRLLCHTAEDREEILEKHLTSTEPTVLVSPSMCEGVSLDGDLSRFQVIAKLPYPSLGDKTIRKRMEKDPRYYDYVTARSFVQSLGRSVRSESDHAVTYVLDGCFSAFLAKNRNMLPCYVVDALEGIRKR